MPVAREDVLRIGAIALSEDGDTDITTTLVAPEPLEARAVVEYRSGGTLAGTPFAAGLAGLVSLDVSWTRNEGDQVEPGEAVAFLTGDVRSILRAERPFLNLLQRASGIATATRRLVSALEGTRCRVLHTRKTAPGLRALDICAVLAGGGDAHRINLSDRVLIKDNHWKLIRKGGLSLEGVLEDAVRRCAAVYVEVESAAQVDQAVAAGATRLLIDNRDVTEFQRLAERAKSRKREIEIEATGRVNIENARAYADAGADYVSVGQITHSVWAADIALELVE